MRYRACMKKWWCLIGLLCLTAPAFATPRYSVFWYPGETGSAVQAQPLLDQFTALLEQETPGVDWNAIYIPVEDKGVSFIRSQRPVFGIVSYAMYWKYRTPLHMTPIAATKLLPSGDVTERLTLVGGNCQSTETGARLLYASQPYPLDLLHAVFAAQHQLLAPWPSSGTVSVTREMRGTLQQLVEHGACHLAVLSAAEQAALKATKGSWAQQVRTLVTSDEVPTPLVVRFGTDPLADTVRGALFKLAGRRDAKPVLQEMRLAGFAAPQSR